MTAPVLQLEGSLDQAIDAPDVATELRCYLKVRAAPVVPAASRALVASICLVIDCSGSMTGDKAEAAIDAARRIVDVIDERHRISLVGFALSSRLIVDNAQATPAGRDALKAKVDRLRQMIGGNTFLGSGIRSGADQVQRFVADARIIVVLSDGAADDPAEAHAQALRARELGIQLFAVGIGDDYEADQLRKLVTPSSGAVLAPGRLDQLAATFGELVARVERFVATSAQIVVTPGDGVHARQLYRALPQPAFIGEVSAPAAREVDIRVGNVELGQTHAFLMTLVVPAHADLTREVARATLTFDVPALGLRHQHQEIVLHVARGGEARAASAEISGAFRSAQIARLVDELADAQRRNAKDECLDRLDLLIRLSDEEGDDRARAAYEQLRAGVAGDRAIEQRALNELVIASTEHRPAAADAPGAVKQLYDVVLVAPGDAPILLLRALRDATGKTLRELSELIARTPVAIREALPRRTAEALVAQIDGSGAGAVLKVRAR
ncbi:MAG TPA: vWA domain-containing protein [Kofleriaceae bacterium]|nr:vWA domain-containing protein [Kofleriaceae bacterium]